MTYAWRLLGFYVPVQGAAMRVAALIPVAAFAALVGSGLKLDPAAWPHWVAVAAGGLAAYRGLPVWGTIALGLGVFWLLRALV